MPRLLWPLAALLILPLGVLSAQSDSTWRDHNRAADAATLRGDWAEARRQTMAMDPLLGGHPAVALALARIAVHTGDTGEALEQLRRIAAMGVTSRGFSDTLFDRLRKLPRFQEIALAIRGNAGTIGHAEVVATVPDSDAIAEDLAWEPSRSRFIVSDVRRRRLRSVGINGDVTDVGVPLPVGWGVLGVAVDAPRGVAWATAVVLPQADGYVPADSGHAAILRYDLATGAVQRRFDLPAPSAAAPGDLAVAENHDVFVGDGQTGAVYVIRAARDSLETLVPAGRLRGTQQPAIAPDRRTIFIPDYGRGIARVDRTSGAVSWLSIPPDVTLTGIDGLVMHGRDLIAVQNGVVPNRIVRLVLDDAMKSVVRADILLRDSTLADEPTHAAVAEGALYLIGNAGWSKYEDDGSPKTGAHRGSPRILRIPLPPR